MQYLAYIGHLVPVSTVLPLQKADWNNDFTFLSDIIKEKGHGSTAASVTNMKILAAGPRLLILFFQTLQIKFNHPVLLGLINVLERPRERDHNHLVVQSSNIRNS